MFNVQDRVFLNDDYYISNKDCFVVGEKESSYIRRILPVRNSFSSLKSEKTANIEFKPTNNDFMDKAFNIIERRLSDSTFDLNKLASEMEITKSTLKRNINLHSELSIKELINSVRVKRSLQLLTDDFLQVSEIAYRVGFDNPRCFSRAFKVEMGLTPKEYRNLILSITHPINESSGQLFLLNAISAIEKNISDTSYNFVKFSIDLNVSKSTLYRRIKYISGSSPSELIKTVRVKRAAVLLTNKQKITDVAYEVGFNDSKYFSRCFKSEFGITPTQYKSLKKAQRISI